MPFKPRGDRFTVTYCWSLAETCQFRRKDVRRRRAGKTWTCSEVSVAYCVEIVDGTAMSVKSACMATMDDCQWLRKELMKQKTSLNQISACQPTRNDQRFERFRVIDDEPAPDP